MMKYVALNLLLVGLFGTFRGGYSQTVRPTNGPRLQPDQKPNRPPRATAAPVPTAPTIAPVVATNPPTPTVVTPVVAPTNAPVPTAPKPNNPPRAPGYTAKPRGRGATPVAAQVSSTTPAPTHAPTLPPTLPPSPAPTAPTVPPTPSPTLPPTVPPTPFPTTPPTPGPTPFPTTPPTPGPTPFPTTPPTPGPTPPPTPGPTPFPTTPPTPFPTTPPTPAPTPAPTPSPTPAPTPAPTPSPTPAPTPSPTPAPTPAPTPSPTPAPTPMPTSAPTGPFSTIANAKRISYASMDGSVAIVDANGNVGIATSGTQYFTFQTGTPALDVALYTANPSPMYYFVEKNAPSTNFLQIYPSYNTVFNSGGSSVTNAAYVATNKNGNVAYVDTSGGLHYSAGAFGTAQSFTTVLASGVIRVSLSTTRLWYIDSSNDVWYVLLANLPGLPGSLVKTNGSQSTEISTGDGTVGGGIEATAVCTNSNSV